MGLIREVRCPHGWAYVSDPRLDLVIVSGETGPNVHPVHPEWVRSLRDQCAAADVAFNFQGWGEYAPSKFATYGKFDQSLAGQIQVSHAVKPSQRNKRRYYPIPSDYNGDVIGIYPMGRVGHKRSGRMLDGNIHDGWPE